ncbi:PEP-CTERM sorting domain-containing protein [Aeoliella sp. ICT_H6.2]|uniref:PEP-CTERM sorting domain-containing protein n=1 Tax=Aeoliella straminimaris TaxID=2954799 RepID=A0A9X2JJI9_9BACT|nr:PEP-CTERM sorting domain-containing protein [Aeoliella straminimaris]MCO6047652.1 PEP-CTERM sorting domain-containing protein [Aeoliella straminimaris]
MKTILKATCVAALCAQFTVAVAAYDEDFSMSDGGYTVTDDGGPTGPWTFSSENEAWFTDGTDNNGAPSHTRLTSPTIDITGSGEYEVSFEHFYSIEGDLWDGGAVFASINGAPFAQVPGTAFSANGYTASGLIGNHDLNGGEGFGGNSPGYPAPITSVASLGSLATGDTVAIEFLMANDEFSRGEFTPNWQINSVSVAQVVPEPTTFVLLASCGLLALGFRRR